MKLAAVGDNCIDYYANINKGYAGGNPVNVAVYFKRLGGESSYIGIVGNDKNGKYMLEQIGSKAVNVSNVNIVEGKTAVTQIELIEGERVFGDYEEGVLKNFKLTEKQKKFILEHNIISTGLWGNIHNELEYFKKNGLLVAFDGATRPFDEAGLIAMKNTDYFFYAIDNYDSKNKEELKENMLKIWNNGIKQVIVTLGEKGSIVYDGKNFTEYGIIKCNVVDTMGAGDSYISGYLMGILKGYNIKECMELGAKTAAQTISYNGAW